MMDWTRVAGANKKFIKSVRGNHVKILGNVSG
jgi:hypothetical protein